MHEHLEPVHRIPSKGPRGAHPCRRARSVDEVDDARRRFPQFTFTDAEHVLLDHSAGVILADVAMEGLRRWLGAAGVVVRHGVRAQTWRRVGEGLEIATDAGVLRVGGIVLAAGAWVGEFVPALRPRLTVIRQHVAYLRLGPAAAMRAPAFPVWAWIGAAADDFFYGLPDAGEGGVKLGRHLVTGPPDDPVQPVGKETPSWRSCRLTNCSTRSRK